MAKKHIDDFIAFRDDEQEPVSPSFFYLAFQAFVNNILLNWKFWALLVCVAIAATGFGVGFSALGIAVVASPQVATILAAAVSWLTATLHLTTYAVAMSSLIVGAVFSSIASGLLTMSMFGSSKAPKPPAPALAPKPVPNPAPAPDLAPKPAAAPKPAPKKAVGGDLDLNSSFDINIALDSEIEYQNVNGAAGRSEGCFM